MAGVSKLKRKARYQKTCVVCQKTFIAYRSDTKTCSADCRREKSNRLKYGGELVDVECEGEDCPGCGIILRALLTREFGTVHISWSGNSWLLVCPQCRSQYVVPANFVKNKERVINSV